MPERVENARLHGVPGVAPGLGIAIGQGLQVPAGDAVTLDRGERFQLRQLPRVPANVRASASARSGARASPHSRRSAASLRAVTPRA
jgi:hypothetical protein